MPRSTLLERGYALHELTFALLFLLIVDIALPVLLLAHIPLFFNGSRRARRTDAASAG
jgi:hypothetical protein